MNTKRIRDLKGCHSSYTRKPKKAYLSGDDLECQISYFDVPQVFSRLWHDAESKNKRLKEIEVKRVNKTKDEYQKIYPHPNDASSSHVNLQELQEFGNKNRYAIIN